MQNLTGLKSLLRLNADGIGDDEDLATLLSRYCFPLFLSPDRATGVAAD